MQEITATTQGKIRGLPVDGVMAFLGIPYADAPTGPALFRAPAPAPAWDGVRDAVTLGPTVPRPPYPRPFNELLTDPNIAGGECLNVNVWTPDPGARGLPVMVWIHGGAFVYGSNAVPTCDGRAFARDGVVLVSVNYRLGAPGFALLPGAPANLGVRDQLAALAWVQDNIAAFGGDPGNVTIFGESAGAMSVTTLVAVAAGGGLFGKAIAQSGAGHIAVTRDDAARVTAELAARLGVEPTAEAFAAVDVDRLIEAQRSISEDTTTNPDPAVWGQSVVDSGMAFPPVLDGELLTARPIDMISAGTGHDIPMLVGTTTDEYRLFIASTDYLDAITPELARGVLALHGYDAAIADTYRGNRPDASAGDVLAAMTTDWFFRVPAIRLAEARADAPSPTYAYEFAWPTPVGRLGACHALEIAFVFDTLETPGTDLLTGPNAPQTLADDMHARWVAFAENGDPGWPAYAPETRAVMTFDGDDARVVHDPRADERRLWDGLV
ncbi:carboxylesterase family protein [Actinoallomurus bryophytorum]|uniref:Carboxylic ester hydrolase n=1 Tax=Actinoallomurus bryophytorum TaxID=1490222 RepID=A0A543CPV4_9ACTN|nr:carboxylesterase/lipase family protein [Actinoallomurus bryophytorum]TQL99135.1 para-nitrobenzyl esterase [Actinoallomurus bryophytorum]